MSEAIKMTRLKNELTTLKNQDVYSLLLFVLFKLKDLREYSTLSELIYILDKDGFLKLCEYFGGLTIKIPTIEELEKLVNVLLLYKYINIDNIEQEEAEKLLKCSAKELKYIRENYLQVVNILTKYLI